MARWRNRDECIAEIGEFTGSHGGGIIRVDIWSHDGGPPRIGLSRSIIRAGCEQIEPVEWLTKKELEQLRPLLKRALEIITSVETPL